MGHNAQVTSNSAAGTSAPNQIIRFVGICLIALMPFGVSYADTLATTSYNFQLLADNLGDYGGGGASATLNGNPGLEIFCVDFANNIYVPQAGYTANLTSLTQAGFGTGSNTRFGAVTQWQNSSIDSELGNTSTEAINIDGASAFQRYEMAAYLVSLYNVPAQSNAYNNGIQTAIWQILNPLNESPTLGSSNYPTSPDTADPTWALKTAADWLWSPGNSQAQIDTYLAGYYIVSDATMSNPGGNLPQMNGFQEMITHVPEPSLFGVLAFAVLGFLWVGRRARTTELAAIPLEK